MEESAESVLVLDGGGRSVQPEMLVARPLLALPDGTVIAGNQRLRAAHELGWKTIPVLFVVRTKSSATGI